MDPLNVEEAGQVLSLLASDPARSTPCLDFRTQDSENTAKVEPNVPVTPPKSTRSLASEYIVMKF